MTESNSQSWNQQRYGPADQSQQKQLSAAHVRESGDPRLQLKQMLQSDTTDNLLNQLEQRAGCEGLGSAQIIGTSGELMQIDYDQQLSKGKCSKNVSNTATLCEDTEADDADTGTYADGKLSAQQNFVEESQQFQKPEVNCPQQNITRINQEKVGQESTNQEHEEGEILEENMHHNHERRGSQDRRSQPGVAKGTNSNQQRHSSSGYGNKTNGQGVWNSQTRTFESSSITPATRKDEFPPHQQNQQWQNEPRRNDNYRQGHYQRNDYQGGRPDHGRADHDRARPDQGRARNDHGDNYRGRPYFDQVGGGASDRRHAGDRENFNDYGDNRRGRYYGNEQQEHRSYARYDAHKTGFHHPNDQPRFERGANDGFTRQNQQRPWERHDGHGENQMPERGSNFSAGPPKYLRYGHSGAGYHYNRQRDDHQQPYEARESGRFGQVRSPARHRSRSRSVSPSRTKAPYEQQHGHHQAERREGQAERREGQEQRREGQPERREGQPERREGQAERREGQAERREGQAERREGQAERREDQAERRESQVERREGYRSQSHQNKSGDGESRDSREPKTMSRLSNGQTQHYYYIESESIWVSKSDYNNPNNPYYQGRHLKGRPSSYGSQRHGEQPKSSGFSSHMRPGDRRQSRSRSPGGYQHASQPRNQIKGSSPQSLRADERDNSPIQQEYTQRVKVAGSSPSRPPLTIERRVTPSQKLASAQPQAVVQAKVGVPAQAEQFQSQDRESAMSFTSPKSNHNEVIRGDESSSKQKQQQQSQSNSCQAEVPNQPQHTIVDTSNNVTGTEMPLYQDDDEDVNDIPAFQGFTEEEVKTEQPVAQPFRKVKSQQQPQEYHSPLQQKDETVAEQPDNPSEEKLVVEEEVAAESRQHDFGQLGNESDVDQKAQQRDSESHQQQENYEQNRQSPSRRDDGIYDQQGIKIETKDNCNIYVAGIPRRTTEDQLRKHFSKFGTILNVHIIKDHNTKVSRGFAYILYKVGREANEAIRNTDQTKPFNDWNITVEHAKRGELVTRDTVDKYQQRQQGRPYGSSAIGYDYNSGSNFTNARARPPFEHRDSYEAPRRSDYNNGRDYHHHHHAQGFQGGRGYGNRGDYHQNRDQGFSGGVYGGRGQRDQRDYQGRNNEYFQRRGSEGAPPQYREGGGGFRGPTDYPARDYDRERYGNVSRGGYQQHFEEKRFANPRFERRENYGAPYHQQHGYGHHQQRGGYQGGYRSQHHQSYDNNRQRPNSQGQRLRHSRSRSPEQRQSSSGAPAIQGDIVEKQ